MRYGTSSEIRPSIPVSATIDEENTLKQFFPPSFRRTETIIVEMIFDLILGSGKEKRGVLYVSDSIDVLCRSHLIRLQANFLPPLVFQVAPSES